MDDIRPLKLSAYICLILFLLITYIDAERELYRWSHPPRIHKTYQPPVDVNKWDYSWKSSIEEIKQ